ncbi:MAG: energy transducer TonB [Hyphomonas sp.]|nr:energy transducer TonB [Hyphomonas sp.]MBM58901.1 energy transducer TonB [Hyphomonas sp.]
MISIQGNSVGGGALHAPFGTASQRMASRQDRRLLTSMVPAAAITLGLFVTMTQLIRVDEVELAPVTHRPLPIVTPQHKETEPNRIDRFPAPVADVELPPMPPVTKSVSSVEGLPVPVIDRGNWDLQREAIRFEPPAPQAIGERIAQAIRRPVASYPADMARRGMEGSCDVHFSLSTRGLPYDITAACSHAGFEKEAVRAVSKAEFLPEIRQGLPVESHNYVYPMEFRLQ